MQFRLVVDVPNQAARPFSWLRAASPAAGARGPHASREKREIAQTERIYGGGAATGSATATDVQLLLELLLQVLLLALRLASRVEDAGRASCGVASSACGAVFRGLRRGGGAGVVVLFSLGGRKNKPPAANVGGGEPEGGSLATDGTQSAGCNTK